MTRSETEEASEAIAASALRVGYGGAPILDGLDFAAPKGAFTALLGPNGCGKSTLLRSLAGLMVPGAGAVLLDGQTIARLSTKAVARQIGLLPQGVPVPEGLSVEDLVRQGRYPHRSLFGAWRADDEAACRRALALTGIEGLAARPLETLSGGQRQRAWIAMTLAQETGILLLDEPTTYLDIAHQIELLELVRRLVDEHGTTAIAVLHDINQAAQWADLVVLMKNGAIAASGAPAATLTAVNLREIFAVETRVIENPVDGTPLVLPLNRARTVWKREPPGPISR